MTIAVAMEVLAVVQDDLVLGVVGERAKEFLFWPYVYIIILD